MAIGNAIHRREQLTSAELASIESVLQQKGYRLVAKANESDLLPGEYLKRQRSSFVYSYASPVAWEVVWTEPAAGQHAQARAKTEARAPRR
jgi:hypothetical protein